MTHTEKSPTERNQPVPFAIPVLVGAAIAFLLISFFIFSAQAREEWGPLWMIKPFIITPLAGATGGAFYYFMDQLRYRNGVNPTVAVILSLLVYLVGLWMGIVLGLNGTMWN